MIHHRGPQPSRVASNETNTRSSTTVVSDATTLLPDNPCWGSPDTCSLDDLLTLASSSSSSSSSKLVLQESPDYIVLNKPPDLRMDGPYPATVYKLLTFWYPPPSLLQQQHSKEELSRYITNHVHQSNNVPDFELRSCHQLDYATSGVLLVARNSKAAAVACESFKNRNVKKVYLALVHGHVQVDQVLRNSGSRNVSQDFLDEYMMRTERIYQKSRKQNKSKTFCGCLPAHSLFQKWKSLRQQPQNPQPSSKEPLHRKPWKRPRTSPMPPQCSQEDWSQIWKATTDLLSEGDQQQLLTLDWKQVKANAHWKQIFTQAAHLHNEQLRAAVEAAADSALPSESTSFGDSTLPTVFRVENDGNLNRFYIYAATSEVPNQFAVQVQEESRLFLAHASHDAGASTVSESSFAASPCSPTTCKQPNSTAAAAVATAVSDGILLDYKPSLTLCTVLDHAFLSVDEKSFPVTKLWLEPKTGRRHQLRVHMAHVLGTPIVQDMTYAAAGAINTSLAISDQAVGLNRSTVDTSSLPSTAATLESCSCRKMRMCLHAHVLEIPLADDQLLTAEAPDPFVVVEGNALQKSVQLLDFFSN